MFEYGQAILVRPVVKHFAKEENRDALRIYIIAIPRGLRIKEILGFLRIQRRQLCANPETT
jgi:intergrase/recombinase